MKKQIIKSKASKIVMMANMLRSSALPVTQEEKDEILKLIVSSAVSIHKEIDKKE